jgi:hypothetical protein
MNVLYFYLFLLVHPYLAMWWKSFPQGGHKSWEGLIRSSWDVKNHSGPFY